MSVLTALVASKIVVGVVVAGVAVTGAGAAVAYTGSLPASLQQVAHDTIDAPAPAEAAPVAATGGGMPGATSIEVVPAMATPSPTFTPPVVVPPGEAANTLEPQKEAETHPADAPEETETPEAPVAPEATEAPEAPQTPEAPEVEKIKAPKASKVPDAPKVKSTETPDATDTPDAPSSDN